MKTRESIRILMTNPWCLGALVFMLALQWGGSAVERRYPMSGLIETGCLLAGAAIYGIVAGSVFGSVNHPPERHSLCNVIQSSSVNKSQSVEHDD